MNTPEVISIVLIRCTSLKPNPEQSYQAKFHQLCSPNLTGGFMKIFCIIFPCIIFESETKKSVKIVWSSQFSIYIEYLESFNISFDETNLLLQLLVCTCTICRMMDGFELSQTRQIPQVNHTTRNVWPLSLIVKRWGWPQSCLSNCRSGMEHSRNVLQLRNTVATFCVWSNYTEEKKNVSVKKFIFPYWIGQFN